ncbi:hypothetical protein GCM10010129_70290 [Streptomyces fumigatiscleroticus]|nr:hypothetical protein GCM10010129_70290 [Streptomyces fumigatiscleroticus]
MSAARPGGRPASPGPSATGSHSASYALTVTGGSGNQCTAVPWAGDKVDTGGRQVSRRGHAWKPPPAPTAPRPPSGPVPCASTPAAR